MWYAPETSGSLASEVARIQALGERFLQYSRLLFDDEASASENAAVCEQTNDQLVAMAEDVLARGAAHGVDDYVRLAALGKYLSNVMDNKPENMGERILQTLLSGVIGLAETVDLSAEKKESAP